MVTGLLLLLLCFSGRRSFTSGCVFLALLLSTPCFWGTGETCRRGRWVFFFLRPFFISRSRDFFVTKGHCGHGLPRYFLLNRLSIRLQLSFPFFWASYNFLSGLWRTRNRLDLRFSLGRRLLLFVRGKYLIGARLFLRIIFQIGQVAYDSNIPMRSLVDGNHNVIMTEDINSPGPFLDTFIIDGPLVRERGIEI